MADEKLDDPCYLDNSKLISLALDGGPEAVETIVQMIEKKSSSKKNTKLRREAADALSILIHRMFGSDDSPPVKELEAPLRDAAPRLATMVADKNEDALLRARLTGVITRIHNGEPVPNELLKFEEMPGSEGRSAAVEFLTRIVENKSHLPWTRIEAARVLADFAYASYAFNVEEGFKLADAEIRDLVIGVSHRLGPVLADRNEVEILRTSIVCLMESLRHPDSTLEYLLAAIPTTPRSSMVNFQVAYALGHLTVPSVPFSEAQLGATFSKMVELEEMINTEHTRELEALKVAGKKPDPFDAIDPTMSCIICNKWQINNRLGVPQPDLVFDVKKLTSEGPVSTGMTLVHKSKSGGQQPNGARKTPV